MMDADELYRFILANAEEIDGQLVCRAAIGPELRRRDALQNRKRLRTRLVKELERRGVVTRPHPRSRWLIINEAPKSTSSTPQTLRISSDIEATRRRRRRFRYYMNGNVLREKDFVCSSWDECESSVPSTRSFTEGQLSHLGKHFDLSTDGRPLRVVVVGQEVGARGGPRITMARRYARVHHEIGLIGRFEGDADHKGRNPHMRGTTLALRALFDRPGTDHPGEFIDVDGERIHMFDCFALVNRLLCAAHLRGTSTGKSTKTMLSNCERHFTASLEILEPTIVVIQGIKVWKWSQDVLVPTRGHGQTLYECDLAGGRVCVCVFTHPSAWGPDRWDSPHSSYYRQVVRPTIRRAFQKSMGN